MSQKEERRNCKEIHCGIYCGLCGLVVTVPGYQIFWEVVGLQRGPLSLVSAIEELLARNSSGSSLENREYGRGDPLRWTRDTLYQQKLALTSPTSGCCSVGIVRLRTKATEFVVCFVCGLFTSGNGKLI
jgi:hypothetical protein